MGINVRCPKCGSTQVQLSDERSRHGCVMTLLFGIIYIPVVIIRWTLGIVAFICLDWWMAILKRIAGKGYAMKSTKLMRGRKRVYYCHECGHNFRG